VDLDANELLASGFISLVGTALLVYGKKQSRLPHGAVGIVMIVFPYFIPNVYAELGIAAALVVALWAVVRFARL
jgi:hypothetical protein